MHDFANCSFYITTSDFSKKISTRFLLNFTGFFVTMGDIKLNENVSQCVSIFPKAIHVSYLTMLSRVFYILLSFSQSVSLVLMKMCWNIFTNTCSETKKSERILDMQNCMIDFFCTLSKFCKNC